MGRGTSKAANWLERLLLVLATALCVGTGAVMAVMVFVGVFYRYVLSEGLPYANALPPFLFPYFIMSGAVVAAVRGEHLSVDYFLRKTPEISQRWIPVLTRALVTIAFVYIAAVSFELVSVLSNRINPVLGWPASWSFYSLPFGFSLLAIHSLIKAVREILDPEDETASNTANEGRT
jgi:TRAP-type C4-dicarboxylate transport system permease small subunit